MRPVIHGGDIYQNEIELDFSVNINPFGIPEKVKEAMQESLELCEHYPDIHHAKLIEKIGAYYHIPEEHILCGNGASELFVAIVHAIKPRKIVIPVPPLDMHALSQCMEWSCYSIPSHLMPQVLLPPQ